MKVGVFTVILRSMPLEQALDYLAGLVSKPLRLEPERIPSRSLQRR